MSRRALLGLALLAGCATAEPAPPPAAPDRATRRFRIRYVTTLTVPKGKRYRLWIPVPKDDPVQTIGPLGIEGPFGSEGGVRHQLEGLDGPGDRLVYVEATGSGAPDRVTVSYVVTRREDRGGYPVPPGEAGAPTRLTRRVVVDDAIRRAHAQLPQGGDARARARAVYDYVLEHMTYDKSGTGWGRGDSSYACRVGKGNCTDYHSYFMALCSLSRVPTRFQIGLFGPYAPRPGDAQPLAGYHCWAEFQAGGRWVPVDISEADKHPERREDCFGNLTPNRVTLSTGRDLVLTPKQDGPPLNFFVEPYCEVDGEPFPQVRREATWTDLESTGRSGEQPVGHHLRDQHGEHYQENRNQQ